MSKILRQLYLWACDRLYDEFAWSYDWVSQVVSLGAWPAWRRLALEIATQDPVLELGFGTGALLAEMAAQGRQVIGLELAPAMHRVTTRRLTTQGLCVGRVQAPAQSMPFASHSFAAVVATFPAPYIVDPATLRECARVLRPGGRLVVVGLWVTSHAACRWRIPFFYGEPAPEQLAALQRRFGGAGFTCEFAFRELGWASVGVVLGQSAGQ